jgi:hypothetical protein
MSNSLANRRSPLGLLPDRPPPRLYGSLAEAWGNRHYSRRTEKAYTGFDANLVFHNGTHPRQMAEMDVQTTMAYTHVLNRGGRGVQSPLIAFAKPNPLRASGLLRVLSQSAQTIFGGT